MNKQRLEVSKRGDRISVLVNGVVVWEGSHGDFSKAIAHPIAPPSPVPSWPGVA